MFVEDTHRVRSRFSGNSSCSSDSGMLSLSWLVPIFPSTTTKYYFSLDVFHDAFGGGEVYTASRIPSSPLIDQVMVFSSGHTAS
jgi:hypothetical protein